MAEVIVVENQNEAGRIVADSIVELIRGRHDAVLGLATGSTPLVVYKSLADRVKETGLDVSQVRGFALDEYVGLPPNHPESYRSVIKREVVDQVGLKPDLVHVPNGDPAAVEHAGPDYDQLIRAAGGIDLQILGIGTDGHIGFNEPGSSLASRTRVKTLTEQTRQDNARFFDSIDDVPWHCVTQGIGTILEARHLVLLAFGAAKADAVAATLEGGICSLVPASALQLHPHVTVLIDQDAASKLSNLSYYRWAYDHKPDWQEI